jgi:lipopolysaccharide/colanic/teichoic acid biosynthesis glycosyltransferase
MKVLSADGSAETAGAEYASENDIRITSVGKLLRKTRLDELPQVINILRGEMSFIGPRPERPEFVQKLTAAMPFYSLRHLVKPGLTGWAQIHKGYYGTIDENLQKLEYDLFYIKNRGPLIDLAITLRTINIVLRMKGR